MGSRNFCIISPWRSLNHLNGTSKSDMRTCGSAPNASWFSRGQLAPLPHRHQHQHHCVLIQIKLEQAAKKIIMGSQFNDLL